MYFSKHVANFLHLHCASFILAALHNLTLRKILGQSRTLRKENKKHKNSVKKYLHRQIANTRPIDNIHNMGNFPLSDSEKNVLNKGLSFVYSSDAVTKDEVFKAFLKFKRRMLLHYHFFRRPSNFLINIQHTDTGQQLRIMLHHIVTTIGCGPLGEGLALPSLVSLLFLSFIFFSLPIFHFCIILSSALSKNHGNKFFSIKAFSTFRNFRLAHLFYMETSKQSYYD